jgi:hypothetical protein
VAPNTLALVVTLAIEVPFVAALFRGQRLRMATVALVVNIATNVVLNHWVTRLGPGAVQVSEVVIVVVEAAVYAIASRPRDVSRALLASALGNALSYGAGFVLVPWLRALG